MCENDESRPLISPFEEVGLRLEDPVVRKDGDIAHIHVAAVNDEGTAVKLPALDAVLPDVRRCELMEGGMGI
jgi:hypothetical protein